MDLSLKSLNKYGNNVRMLDTSVIRIVLGIFIFYKGVYFVQHTELLNSLLESYSGIGLDYLLYHYVIMGHLAGGLFLIIGFVTRIAAWTQIPILAGAVIANLIVGDASQLMVSSLVLAALLFIGIVGSGKRSVDYGLKLGI